MKCPNCGSLKLVKRGKSEGSTGQRYVCNSCGKYCTIHLPKVDESTAKKPLDTQVPTISPKDILELEKRLSRISEENRVDKAKIHYLQNQLASSNRTIDILTAFSKAKVPRVIEGIKPVHKGKNEATAVICLSDLHLEENVDPRTVNGLNEFNPEIAEKRFKTVIRNALKLTQSQGKEIDISQVIIWLGGDIISGYIHDELVEGNHLSPVEAILFADRLITWGLDFFLNNTKYNILVPTSNGNHGRTTKKIHISTYAANSYEYLLYKNLEKRYQNEKRIRFQVAEGYHNYVDVYGISVRFHHGDSVKYSGGTGGIYVPVNKSIDAWNGGSLKADLDVMGHFHQLTWDRKFVCNGSLIGLNPFGISIKASPEPPAQAFFLLDKQRQRRTVSAPIFVD